MQLQSKTTKNEIDLCELKARVESLKKCLGEHCVAIYLAGSGCLKIKNVKDIDLLIVVDSLENYFKYLKPGLGLNSGFDCHLCTASDIANFKLTFKRTLMLELVLYQRCFAKLLAGKELRKNYPRPLELISKQMLKNFYDLSIKLPIDSKLGYHLLIIITTMQNNNGNIDDTDGAVIERAHDKDISASEIDMCKKSLLNLINKK